MHHQLPRKSLLRVAVAAVAVPALFVGLAGIASAAEIGPFAATEAVSTDAVEDAVDEVVVRIDDAGHQATDRLEEGLGRVTGGLPG